MTLLLVWWLTTSLQTAPEPDGEVVEMRGQIADINQDLARLEQRLAEIRGQSERLSDEIAEIELQRAVLNGKIEKHELELKSADRELALNGAEQETLRARAERQRKLLSDRLRKLYKRGSLGYSQLFLKQSRLSELITAYHYAKVLTDRDQEALIKFQQTLARLDVIRLNLERLRDEADTARAQLAAEEKNLADLIAKRNRKMREIRNETKQNRRLFADLELEREELRMMIRRVTETDADPMELQVPVSRYRGKLDWPTDGRLLRRFGVFRDPEFGTKRRQNGIHIGIQIGQPIKAVYSGRVVYADWFKSYGNLIIIDHDEKVISFYAHCDKLLVSQGDYVSRDEVVALAGDTGSLEGPRLHFEIREQTEPVDPLKWLTRSRR